MPDEMNEEDYSSGPEWAEEPSAGMRISFGVEGVPFSQVFIPLTREAIVQGVAAARLLFEAYREAFPPLQSAPGDPGPAAAPRDYGDQLPRQTRPQNEAYIVGFCPEHRDERGLQAAVKLTAPQYQDPERHDKVYHPLLEKDQYPDKRTGQPVRNHNFYWRLTVDADGYSNKDRPVPGTTDPDDQPF